MFSNKTGDADSYISVTCNVLILLFPEEIYDLLSDNLVNLYRSFTCRSDYQRLHIIK